MPNSAFDHLKKTSVSEANLRSMRNEAIIKLFKQQSQVTQSTQAEDITKIRVAVAQLESETRIHKKLIDRLISQLTQSNKLIALNMFAVVRLELGTSVDKIINDALDVKRLHTGSGTAKMVAECATAMAMMAGNVLSAGGLAAVGQIVSGAAKTTNALVHNDAKGVMASSTGIAAGTIDTTNGDSQQWKGLGSAQMASNTSTSQQNALTTNIQDSASVAYDAAVKFTLNYLDKAAPDKEITQFKLKKNKVAFVIPHGAGGTSAITYDVKSKITESYKNMVEELQVELTEYAQKENPATGKILKLIMDDDNFTTQKSQSALHPLTTYVLLDALKRLADEVTEYKKLPGRSGHFRDQSGYAKNAVTQYYKKARETFNNKGNLDVDPKFFTSTFQRNSANMAWQKEL